MPGFQMPITIDQAMGYINTNYYVLPAFQRDFVWSADQIGMLFDSLMRGYPTSSMLFWSVKGDTKTSWNFYKFIPNFIKDANNKAVVNELYNTKAANDFFAVLDGQQRLTAMRIGLFGKYAYHERNKSWNFSAESFPNRTLYLCITKYGNDEEGMKYIFDFLRDDVTNVENIYDDGTDKWFRVGYIDDVHTSGLNKYLRKNDLGETAEDILDRLDATIYTDKSITYYLEEEQNPDKAVNIFTRINSGGTELSFSDIMFSLMVANWSTIDAKTEIRNLQDLVNIKGFEIDKDFIVKAFLYLYHNSIKTEIRSFDKRFCSTIESNWNNIRDCISSTFDLLKTFGLNNYTLTSRNAVMPIIYYLYHNNRYKDFSTSVGYKADREIIKKWLLKVLVRRVFGASTDSVLTQTRKAFTYDISKAKIETAMAEFPANSISQNMKLGSVEDDFLDQLLDLQKDDKYAFSILALLYPNMDYQNNNFHKDHLHPDTRYDELPDAVKQKYPFKVYNSIRNLQMLDANENESKGKKLLSDWVDENTTEATKATFLANHLIPDVDLSMANFDEYITTRSTLLKTKLKSILS